MQFYWRTLAAALAQIGVALKRLLSANLPQNSGPQSPPRAIDVSAILRWVDTNVLVPTVERTKALTILPIAAWEACKVLSAMQTGLNDRWLTERWLWLSIRCRQFATRLQRPDARFGFDNFIWIGEITRPRTIALPFSFFRWSYPQLLAATRTGQQAPASSRRQRDILSSFTTAIESTHPAREATVFALSRTARIIKKLATAMEALAFDLFGTDMCIRAIKLLTRWTFWWHQFVIITETGGVSSR